MGARVGEAPKTNGSSGPAHAGPFEPIARRIEEIVAEARHLLGVRADAFKLSLRKAGIAAGLGMIGAIGGGALVAVAIVELISGIAGGLGELLGARWLGGIVAGGIVLAALAGTIVLGLKKMERKHREQTLARYAERKAAQRRRFGHDFAELARHDGNGGARV